MAGEAQRLARQREQEAYEATQLAQLPPTDPIRRAKILDGVPAPTDEGAPNGTAKKAEGEGEATAPGADSQGQPTPNTIPEVQPTIAKVSRPAKPEGAPSGETESVAKPARNRTKKASNK